MKLRSNLQRSIESTLSFCNLKIIFHLSTLFRCKDTIHKKLCSGLVHRFKCSNCNVTYYGKTKCHFFVRAADHMDISHLTGKTCKKCQTVSNFWSFQCRSKIGGREGHGPPKIFVTYSIWPQKGAQNACISVSFPLSTPAVPPK